jgi:IS605 OrfB family transposase
VLSARVTFPHRGPEWADRGEANRAVGYRIHHDVGRRRWYLTACWQYAPAPAVPLGTALAHGVIGVDTTRLLNWARTCRVQAIAIEDLDFTAEKTREKHGRKKKFRQVIHGLPTGRLRARLTSMADATGIAVIAVDPAYTSKGGAQYWQRPTTTTTRKTSRHDAVSVAVGRRAQGHPVR